MKKFHASSHRTPIYQDSGFSFKSIDDAARAFAAEGDHPQSSDDFIYTRYGNPTVQATEAAISSLEASRWSILTSSGMSAIDTALSIYQEKDKVNTWLFCSELYGGTNVYIDEILVNRRGVKASRLPVVDGTFSLETLQAMLIEQRPGVVFFESISNPLLIVPAARQAIDLAKESGAAVIIDNTFGSPFLWRPLQDSADLVVHSATKYLGGHGNVTAGVVCGDDSTLQRKALKYRKNVGCILSPDDAYRLGTQLMTFDLRFARQCENAARLAELLDLHEKVEGVLYPGLAKHPTHREAVTLFGGKGFGAMVTFVLKGKLKACKKFVELARNTVAYVPTLGDANSILLHVSSVFGENRYPDQGMIRFSVGCEDFDVIERVVTEALAGIE